MSRDLFCLGPVGFWWNSFIRRSVSTGSRPLPVVPVPMRAAVTRYQVVSRKGVALQHSGSPLQIRCSPYDLPCTSQPHAVRLFWFAMINCFPFFSSQISFLLSSAMPLCGSEGMHWELLDARKGRQSCCTHPFFCHSLPFCASSFHAHQALGEGTTMPGTTWVLLQICNLSSCKIKRNNFSFSKLLIFPATRGKKNNN